MVVLSTLFHLKRAYVAPFHGHIWDISLKKLYSEFLSSPSAYSHLKNRPLGRRFWRFSILTL